MTQSASDLTDTHDTGHVPAVSLQDCFSEAEWQSFQREDMAAGKYVVCLMLGIFLVGVVLYTGVAVWTASAGS